jgi:hypothetical protein
MLPQRALSPITRESAVGESQDVCALTDEERHLIRLLRHSPQSVTTMAEALYISPEQTQDV